MRNSSAILLRKVSGALTACIANRTTLTMSVQRPTLLATVLSFAVFLIPILAVVALIGVLAPKAIAIAAIAKLGVLPFVGETETVTNHAAELREKYKARLKEFGEILELAGPDKDLSRKTVLEKLGAKDAAEAFEKLESRDRELNGLQGEIRSATLKRLADDNERRERELSIPSSSTREPAADTRVKTLGQMFVESKAYREVWVKNRKGETPVMLDVDLKTLFETGAGFAPESVRSGLLVPSAQAPLALIDLVPTRPMTQAVDKYMAETTATLNAAEKAEGVSYAESVFEWTEKTSAVQKITTSLPVTDEQIDDVAGIAAILDSRLRFDMRKRLNRQLAIGDGTPPNLAGFLDDSRTDVQTLARGADPRFDAIFKAMIKVIYTGGAMPSAIVLNPTDWQSIRLARTADGQYIMGNPSQPGAQSLFGQPIVVENTITQGTALTGDFLNFSYVGEKKGMEVQVGYVGNNFTDGKKTLRGDVRVCFTVPREAAFCTVTGM